MIKAIRYILLLTYISCIFVGCGDNASSTVVEENLSSDIAVESVKKGDNVSLQQYGMGHENIGENATLGEQIEDTQDNTQENTSELNEKETSTADSEKITTISEGSTLEIHYIDVGQGDSIFIKQGMNTMLIDAGNNDKGTTVWSYLLNQDVDALDYAICTHPDADHIGGMDVVLYKFDCDSVLMPACEHDTETYGDLIHTIGQRGQKVTVPNKGETYSLGEAQFQILTDTDKNYGDNNNDYSIAIRLTFGETSFLFTGDAEKEAEQDMMNSGLALESNVYKAAHHGANWSNTESFLTVVNPSYVVISCGEGNSYGHPRAEVLNNLRSMGVKVFRTDEQGSIVATSDGVNITFNCSPSTTWKAGEPTGIKDSSYDEEETDSAAGQSDGKNEQSSSEEWRYVLNTRSMKIHYPHCSSVDNMSEKNKGYSNLSKEELMAQGYEPCGNCKP
ncbi:MAG: MBL fold metallo-hydrolase [Lachnospiraceae bacterium]|nr:MBL fold metallo-hydrolase [Lachnospiraceae bacterium]